MCDGVSLSAIAEAEGTPVYVYSAAVLRERYRAIDSAFGSHPHRLHYALKANSTLALARMLRELGSAADANSIWEIELARKAGFAPPPISSSPASANRRPSSNAPCRSASRRSTSSRRGSWRVEAIAARLGLTARVALRQPRHRREEPSAHFDRPQDQQVRRAARRCAGAVRDDREASPPGKLVALHVHIGSQVINDREAAGALGGARRRGSSPSFPANVIPRTSRSATSISAAVSAFRMMDFTVPTADMRRRLLNAVGPTGLPIVIEPGRAIVGPSGARSSRA